MLTTYVEREKLFIGKAFTLTKKRGLLQGKKKKKREKQRKTRLRHGLHPIRVYHSLPSIGKGIVRLLFKQAQKNIVGEL